MPSEGNIIPLLKANEVGVIEKVLGSGGFCTVSPVRWVNINAQNFESSSESQLNARSGVAKQFKDYEEKYHSSKNIVVPGYTTPKLVDPTEQKPPRVALKRVKPSLKQERYIVGVNDLVAEASILAQCSHPNIISLYAVGHDSSEDEQNDCDHHQTSSLVPPRISFVIIDQLRSTLRNRMYKWKESRGVTPSIMRSKKAVHDLWLERLVVIIKVADAIRYLHSKGFVHRDIHPDNIGFTDDDVVKLFDFGLAKSVGREGKNNDVTSDGGVDGDDNQLFDLTSMTGTLRYMSPEVALELPYGFKVDIYSLALVMHEILSLAKPFLLIKEPTAFTQKVSREGFRPPLDNAWPDTIQELLQQMWSSDSAKRPSSREVVDRLGALLRGSDDELYPNTHETWGYRFAKQIEGLITN